MTNDQPTEREIAEAKERRRDVALRNLKESNLLNLNIAYSAQRKESGYGETDNDAVEEFLYFPAFNSGAAAYDLDSGEKSDLIRDVLLGSRQDGERYSGQVSEYGILKTSAAIIQQSLAAVKVSDVMELVGSDVAVDEKYRDRYVADLFASEDEEDKKLGRNLIGAYQTYMTTKGVSRALDQRAKAIKSGLEDLVKGEERPQLRLAA